VEEVENFIDCCLSIEDLIDVHSTAINRRNEQPGKYHFASATGKDNESATGHFAVKKRYMDRYINPPEASCGGH
jgi:stage V sporulation protein R